MNGVATTARSYSFYFLIAAVLVPLVLAILIVGWGHDLADFPIVGALFWTLVICSALLALLSLPLWPWRARSISLRSPEVLLLTVIVYLGLAAVLLKSLPARPPDVDVSSRESAEKAAEKADDRGSHCGVRVVGRNEPPSYLQAGTAGTLGWHLYLANAYRWKMEIDIAENANRILLGRLYLVGPRPGTGLGVRPITPVPWQ